MGLDQHSASFSRKEVNNPDAGADLTITKDAVPSKLAYWRKHPYLQGWMENLYYEKGGKGEEFNCVNVRLDEDDLNRLKEDVLSGSLPETTGFFFGSSYADEEDIKWRNEHDMKCIEDMLKALENGDSIYYSSSW